MKRRRPTVRTVRWPLAAPLPSGPDGGAWRGDSKGCARGVGG
ncbi:hypothetical protein SZ55_3069 [Pseudomonas sp. FeS53a]|nr:hypothetical protein SZ55_3069 [Pseudomonas sp. FeS53a]